MSDWTEFRVSRLRKVRVRATDEFAAAFEVYEMCGEWMLEIDGGIRWDGCANFYTHGPAMFHTCGPEGVDELATCLRVAYALAAIAMNDDVEYDVPELPEEWTE